MTDDKLTWAKDEATGECPIQYVADFGERSYVVRPYSPAAHDGDPLLVMHDEGYHPDAWSLRVWHSNLTKGPLRLFEHLADALLAAQDEEDQARA